mmetsp:Transcript_36109/g.87792  ORF Transcript_36109/g.87792 Transcript_36109/m.87792 type:complete len:405 (-) Transcript_36109:1015-2229(-)
MCTSPSHHNSQLAPLSRVGTYVGEDPGPENKISAKMHIHSFCVTDCYWVRVTAKRSPLLIAAHSMAQRPSWSSRPGAQQCFHADSRIDLLASKRSHANDTAASRLLAVLWTAGSWAASLKWISITSPLGSLRSISGTPTWSRPSSSWKWVNAACGSSSTISTTLLYCTVVSLCDSTNVHASLKAVRKSVGLKAACASLWLRSSLRRASTAKKLRAKCCAAWSSTLPRQHTTHATPASKRARAICSPWQQLRKTRRSAPTLPSSLSLPSQCCPRSTTKSILLTWLSTPPGLVKVGLFIPSTTIVWPLKRKRRTGCCLKRSARSSSLPPQRKESLVDQQEARPTSSISLVREGRGAEAVVDAKMSSSAISEAEGCMAISKAEGWWTIASEGSWSIASAEGTATSEG